MKRLFSILLVVPALAGCSLFDGNAVRVSGKALSIRSEVPEHSHVQVDGQCLTCLRHVSEDLTDRVNTLDVQVNRYQAFAKQNANRMVEKLTAKAMTPAETEE